jgi:hypothetical protein
VSKNETPVTEGFWMSAAHGAFIPEYPLILKPGTETSQRWADAVILPDEPHGRAQVGDYPSPSYSRRGG